LNNVKIEIRAILAGEVDNRSNGVSLEDGRKETVVNAFDRTAADRIALSAVGTINVFKSISYKYK
jgi:hypothetical protein